MCSSYQVGDLVENVEHITVMRDGSPYHIEKGTTLRVTGIQGGIIQACCHFDEFGPLYFTDRQITPALMTCF